MLPLIGDTAYLIITWRSALMFAVCLPIVIIACMLLARRVEGAANKWLAGFLVVGVLAQVPQIIGFAGFYTVWPGLTFAPFTLKLFAGPLLYLHASSLMQDTKVSRLWWSLAPGVIEFGYYLWAFTCLGDYQSKWAYTEAVHLPYIWPVETALGLGFLIIAVVAVYRLIGRYRSFLQDTQSAAADFEPLWLSRLIIAMVIAGGLFACIELAPVFLGEVSYVDEFPLQIAMTAVVAWLAFQALLQTTVRFPKMGESTRGEGEELAGPRGKDWVAEALTLKRAVADGNWYLESRLSIGEVASRMATNETYVSRAVNKGLGLTFNAFINQLRVGFAKELLSSSNLPLLHIAAESGFNSKATFNRVFRDLAGQTPTQYRTSQNP
ncbi:MAG: helix-turn-helix domain-containing protein [Lysobacterales bacterium]